MKVTIEGDGDGAMFFVSNGDVGGSVETALSLCKYALQGYGYHIDSIMDAMAEEVRQADEEGKKQ